MVEHGLLEILYIIGLTPTPNPKLHMTTLYPISLVILNPQAFFAEAPQKQKYNELCLDQGVQPPGKGKLAWETEDLVCTFVGSINVQPCIKQSLLPFPTLA